MVRSFSAERGVRRHRHRDVDDLEQQNAARALVPPGTYTIEVVVTDAAGNVSAVGRGTWVVAVSTGTQRPIRGPG